MKINLTQTFTNLDGSTMLVNETKEPLRLGKILASLALATPTGGKKRLYELAKNLYNVKNENIDLSPKDVTLLKNVAENVNEGIPTIILGQVVTFLEEAEKKDDPTKAEKENENN